MKSIRFNIWFFLIVLIASSLLTSCKQNNGYTIIGKITNAEQVKVYLEDISENQPVTIDTAVIKKAVFTLEGYTAPGIYRLRFGDDPKSAIFLYVDEKETIQVNADRMLLSEYTVEGSMLSLHIQQIMTKVQQKYKVLDGIYGQINTASGSTRDSLQRNFAAEQKDLVKVIKEFVDKEENPDVACFALVLFGPSMQDEIPYLVDITQKLHESAPDSKYVKSWYTSMQQYRDALMASSKGGIAVGSEAPDIVLQNPSGDTIKLSSLRGQYVLLDFWASWCGPCRQENPNVVKIYKKYHAKGFDIFSVSLDANKEQWIRAIAKDGLIWSHHGCDFGGWQSAPAQAYSIQAIPSTLLLDKSGIVIAKDLRGEELEERLNKLLNTTPAP